MQEVLNAFGINYGLIVAQVFNFVILAGALWYFLYNPVLKILNDREEKIKKSIADAEQVEKMLNETDAEKNRILKEAHTEASQVVLRGTQYAEEKSKQLEASTEEKIAKQLESAKMSAEEIKLKAIRESDSEIARLAVLGAEKILTEKLNS